MHNSLPVHISCDTVSLLSTTPHILCFIKMKCYCYKYHMNWQFDLLLMMYYLHMAVYQYSEINILQEKKV